MKEYQPYTYIVFDPITEKLYIGSKYSQGCTPENTKNYFGSPTSKNNEYREIIKNRPETLIKIILVVWYTAEQAIEYEATLHSHFNVESDSNFFNNARQTSSGFSFRAFGSANPMYGKQSPGFKGRNHSDKTKAQMGISRLGDKNGMFGENHTDETRIKMSKNHADFSGENNPNSKRWNIYEYQTNRMIAENIILSNWCHENGYSRQHLGATARGKRKHHRGLYANYANKELT